jgi:hypothetical protein
MVLSRNKISKIFNFINSNSLAVNADWVELFAVFYSMTRNIEFTVTQTNEALDKIMDEMETHLDSCEVINFMGAWNIFVELTDGSTVHFGLDEGDYWQNAIETTNAEVLAFVASLPDEKRGTVENRSQSHRTN